MNNLSLRVRQSFSSTPLSCALENLVVGWPEAPVLISSKNDYYTLTFIVSSPVSTITAHEQVTPFSVIFCDLTTHFRFSRLIQCQNVYTSQTYTHYGFKRCDLRGWKKSLRFTTMIFKQKYLTMTSTAWVLCELKVEKVVAILLYVSPEHNPS